MAQIPRWKIRRKKAFYQTKAGMLGMIALLPLIFNACSSDNKSNAYGQFEATETTISSETSGKLMKFAVDEGYKLNRNQEVGVVDTTKQALQIKELIEQMKSIRAKIVNINAQVDVQKTELDNAQTDLQRIQALIKDGAATQKQLDDARTRVQATQRQIHALETQKQSIRAEVQATKARIAQIREQINDALIINPIEGVVLTSFAEPYEIVQPGQPLYRIANLDTLELRVYISGAQLPSVKLGQQVEVLVDKNAKENQQLSGTVSWIASEAEFTPKMIQTKEERVTQVYAVKVRVANPDGILKIGMPGEVNFVNR